MLFCKYCKKYCKNRNSLAQHERLCKKNKNRNICKILEEQKKRAESVKTRKERGTFKNQWSDPEYKIKDSTIKKIIESNKKQIWDDNRKKRHSIIMKNVVKNNPESYSSSNRGRTKQIIFDNIKFQGKWELEFYQYCKFKKIKIIRSNEWFEYEWNGIRRYLPDFYLCEFDLYVEIKGYETQRDIAKWKFFPKKLKIIKKNDMIQIRNNTWNFFECQNHYKTHILLYP